MAPVSPHPMRRGLVTTATDCVVCGPAQSTGADRSVSFSSCLPLRSWHSPTAGRWSGAVER